MVVDMHDGVFPKSNTILVANTLLVVQQLGWQGKLTFTFTPHALPQCHCADTSVNLYSHAQTYSLL